jgi:hypothetical protein
MIRRTVASAGGLALGGALSTLPAYAQVAIGNIPDPGNVTGPVSALLPRGDGHQFVWLGDCTSGVPGARHERNFAAINKLMLNLDPVPEHVVFLGDNVAGYAVEEAELRAQWKYFLEKEFTFARDRDVPVYNMGSNHNTYNPMAERVFRDIFPNHPKNGPLGQEGIAYWVREGDLLYVVTNTSCSVCGGDGHVETEWVDQVLTEHRDARYKFVCGHHPAFPVNGYANLSAADPDGFIEPAVRAVGQPATMPYFRWHIVRQNARAFWDVLARHQVSAYLCSHIILYDVQVHDGVLQICTSGAGTNWGPDGFMPGMTEYYHLIQGALDESGLRYQVLDSNGQVREWLRWPLEMPAVTAWQAIPQMTRPTLPKPAGWDQRPSTHHLVGFSVEADLGTGGDDQTLICGWDDQEGGHILWIGLVGTDHKIEARLVPEPGHGTRVWRGPALGSGGKAGFDLLIHTGLGPGGIMVRSGDGAPWTSLTCSSSSGADAMAWPARWATGHAISDPEHMPFRGRDLKVKWFAQPIEQDQNI